MGVPKFYRWISERYPCLSEVVKEFQLPEFDNLYLDMNGIIHVCSHPDDENPHYRTTEDKIFTDICHYIDFLFRMIKPRKVFFMAVDGVAPRAKMNQQRGRRFRSAREAEDLIEKAKKAGEVLPTEKRFDSNCITPGTPFMVRLQEHLKYFVNDKITRDPSWQEVSVYLSGHETPGEGEHKIMDYIRWSKSQPGYDGNTRHCLYGLDADLIMLGLTSHERNFSLLREEVRFEKKDRNKRQGSAEETTFHLLHLSLMRDYLAYEFSPVKDKLPFPWDLERLIDDWILMGFLVGNDFIPHLPNFHIHHDALPILWEAYMKVLPTLGGYINDGGYLNLPRLEKYFEELKKHDKSEFRNAFSDLKYLEGKLGEKSINVSAGNAAAAADMLKRSKKPRTLPRFGGDDIRFLSQDEIELEEKTYVPDEDSDEDFDTMEEEFSQHKKDYYMSKIGLPFVGPQQLQELSEGYVLALQWILLYYFEGVPSWSWFYPHHYSPYISDIQGFQDMKIEFDLSTPFLPFQQLMAVLPAASKDLIPPSLQPLMTESSSPVLHFYPVNFEFDLNGKQQSWEAVVLIPFIEEEKLLSAMASREHLLTREERSRNAHGPHNLYKYTSANMGFYPSTLPGTCPDIHTNRTKCTHIEKNFFRIESKLLKKGLGDNVDLNEYFPGFPSLRHIPHTHELKAIGVKVFQQISRNKSVVLLIDSKPDVRLEQLADEILGKTIFVGWPHLHEARVTSIANESFRIELLVETGKNAASVSFNRRPLGDLEAATVASEANAIKERHKDRFAIDVGKTEIVVYASPMTGRTYTYGPTGAITLDKQFASQPTPFVYQLTTKELQIKESGHTTFKTLDEVFPIDATIFMLGTPHYGAQGKVLEVLKDSARIRIALEVTVEPDLQQLGLMHMNDRYLSAHQASHMIGVSTHIISRITGSVFVEKKTQSQNPNQQGGKVNIGLNLKFTKREEEVPGYTRKEPNGWTYSKKCVEVVSQYINEFPSLWQRVSSSRGGTDVFTHDDLFPEEGSYKFSDVMKFLDDLPSSKATKMKFGCEILDDEQVARIENMTTNVSKNPIIVKMKIKPRLLFRPLTELGSIVPDPQTDFLLYDRIVVVKSGFSVPFGKRGTIIGIPMEESGTITPHSTYDVVFDEPFAGGVTLRCSPGRGYKVPGSAMLNMTYGEFRKNRPVSERPTAGVWNKGRTNKAVVNGSNNNSAQYGAGGIQQSVRWDSKRQPLFGQVFAGNDGIGQNQNTVKPEFVTPKVTAPQPVMGSKANLKTDSVDFNSLWINLQKEKDLKSNGSPRDNSSVSLAMNTPQQPKQMPKFDGPAKVKPGPSNNMAEPIKILTKPQASDKPSPDPSKPFTAPLVQTLFASPSKLGSASPQTAPTSTENAEFMAMFNSLKLQSEELQHKSNAKIANSKDSKSASSSRETPGMLTVQDLEKVEETKMEKLEAKAKEADNAIKQMLKIGTGKTVNSKSASPSLSPRLPTSSSASPSNFSTLPPLQPTSASYGKQVSLQELFDQANRQLKTQTKEDEKKDAVSVEKKDSVRELETFCAANGLKPPSYEFRHPPGKQTAYIANILIHNRGRYEGSVCPDKMEAAQSAASIALLCLRFKPNQPNLTTPFVPGAPRTGSIHPLFSQNSAFSPIGHTVQRQQGQFPVQQQQVQIPVQQQGGQIQVQQQLGQIPHQQHGGQIPVQQQGSQILVQKQGGQIPVQQQGGQIPVQQQRGPIPVQQPQAQLPVQQPGLMRPPPLLTPRHFTTQPPPPTMPLHQGTHHQPPPLPLNQHPPLQANQPPNPMLDQLHRQLQQLANQFNLQQQQMQSIQMPNFNTSASNRHTAPQMQQMQHQPQQSSNQNPLLSPSADKGSISKAAVVSQPFIPLQVTRNQKTPKSKKDDESSNVAQFMEKTSATENDIKKADVVSPVLVIDESSHKLNTAIASSQNSDTSSSQGFGSSTQAFKPSRVQTTESNPNTTSNRSSESDTNKKVTSAMPKKKSRLAANFSMKPAAGSSSLSQTK